jgi:tetratricopeptide (TPR) repeat protein
LASLVSLARSAAQPKPSREQEDVYEGVIDRAFMKARQAAQEVRIQRACVQKLVRRLERGGMASLPTVSGEERIVAVVEALLQRSWALRHVDPFQMLELAQFAEMASRRLEAEDDPRLRDLLCRVWLGLGNAYRIVEKLDEAESAFGHALMHHLHGTGDRLILAHFLDLRSSLHRARRELGAAREYLKLACNIYRRHGQRHMAGRALIKAGILAGHAGSPKKALGLIERGLSMVDEKQAEDLVFTAIHNQLWLLVDCGRVDEARRLLFVNRFRYDAAGGDLTRIKLRWLEARIDAGLGKIGRAVEGFRAVREDFERLELGYDAALATLDLAAVVLRLRQFGEARDLVGEAAEVFKALRIEREALAAVVFLRESFELRRTTLELLEEVTAFLRRAQHDPAARFVPSSR